MVVGCEAMLQHRETSCRTENGQHKFQTGMMIFVTAIKKKKTTNQNPMPWELFRGWQKYCRFTKPLKGEALPYLLRGGRTCGPSEGTGGVQVLLVAAPTRLGMSGAEQGAALNTQSCKTPNLRVFFSPETTFDYFFFPPLFFFSPPSVCWQQAVSESSASPAAASRLDELGVIPESPGADKRLDPAG